MCTMFICIYTATLTSNQIFHMIPGISIIVVVVASIRLRRRKIYAIIALMRRIRISNKHKWYCVRARDKDPEAYTNAAAKNAPIHHSNHFGMLRIALATSHPNRRVPHSRNNNHHVDVR